MIPNFPYDNLNKFLFIFGFILFLFGVISLLFGDLYIVSKNADIIAEKSKADYSYDKYNDLIAETLTEKYTKQSIELRNLNLNKSSEVSKILNETWPYVQKVTETEKAYIEAVIWRLKQLDCVSVKGESPNYSFNIIENCYPSNYSQVSEFNELRNVILNKDKTLKELLLKDELEIINKNYEKAEQLINSMENQTEIINSFSDKIKEDYNQEINKYYFENLVNINLRYEVYKNQREIFDSIKPILWLLGFIGLFLSLVGFWKWDRTQKVQDEILLLDLELKKIEFEKTKIKLKTKK